MNSQVLTPEELEKCKEAFDAFDKDTSGGIDPEELRTVLKFMGQEPSEEEIYRMISEVDEGNTGTITWESFRAMIEKQKLEKGGDDESDTLDAYVAMGGNPDGSGCVEAQRLIHVIKNEFGMTIDIEKLIQEVDTDGSGEIEYDEFKTLLSSTQLMY
eukprot:TRINITY_DN20928_c0_g1_i1.p1 TRINITY_DN20928_c0_g1~~TRINITY_DN20928_c0_g1_i1.p1  ORF type:complete len:164 (+),score=40.30 TRINITY_DN20928_c0_g1_i1:23-493(+)